MISGPSPADIAPSAMLRPAPELSVVIPVRNEADNIAALVAEIRTALAGIAHEIVYVDDGSSDDTAARIAALDRGDIRLLRHERSCGQSAAVRTGVRHAAGRAVATLDGDGQNDPGDIPALYGRLVAAGRARPMLIAGNRTTRRDTATKRLSSRLANRIRAQLLGDGTPDTGCGLKLFWREDFLALPYFDHMHRYLPALFLREGGGVLSLPVNHRPRGRGQSNYGTLDRLWVGIWDLMGVLWLQRRARVPRIVSDEGFAAPSLPAEPSRGTTPPS